MIGTPNILPSDSQKQTSIWTLAKKKKEKPLEKPEENAKTKMLWVYPVELCLLALVPLILIAVALLKKWPIIVLGLIAPVFAVVTGVWFALSGSFNRAPITVQEANKLLGLLVFISVVLVLNSWIIRLLVPTKKKILEMEGVSLS